MVDLATFSPLVLPTMGTMALEKRISVEDLT